ncbi:hypothetical protein D1AOALGA4SA_12277 [Olavius algarvensis Delta 1 endosymbiont]|nr:hypothetical protein D1AOALGA4SA_12277 [Olavius algarvensis Delta 1 endosymbiont]
MILPPATLHFVGWVKPISGYFVEFRFTQPNLHFTGIFTKCETQQWPIVMLIKNISTTIFVIALMSIVAAGCSATRKSGLPIEESGFLCDYSLLSQTDSTIPGDAGPRPRLRYINPDAD